MSNLSQRWNIDRDGNDLLVCFDDHGKGEKCEYVRYKAATDYDALAARVAELEAENRTLRNAGVTLQEQLEAARARLAAADALADAAYSALPVMPATVVTLAGRVPCQEYGKLGYALAAYRATQPNADGESQS